MPHFKHSLRTLLAFSCLSAGALGAMAVVSIPAQSQDDAQIVANMSEEQLGEFVKSYLLENPTVIIDAVENYNKNMETERQVQAKEKLVEHEAFLTSIDQNTTAGPKDAPITIVEFFDYNCGYCKKAIPDVQQVLEENDDVRFVFKELPILSQSSIEASQYALAAAEQGDELYFKYHVALMEHNGNKDKATLERLAEDVGLDVKKLKKDAQSDAVKTEIQTNLQVSQDLGIRGTPAFIIGDSISPGYISADAMASIIESQRGAAE